MDFAFESIFHYRIMLRESKLYCLDKYGCFFSVLGHRSHKTCQNELLNEFDAYNQYFINDHVSNNSSIWVEDAANIDVLCSFDLVCNFLCETTQFKRLILIRCQCWLLYTKFIIHYIKNWSTKWIIYLIIHLPNKKHTSIN